MMAGSEPKRRTQTPWVEDDDVGGVGEIVFGAEEAAERGAGQRSGRKLEVMSATLICSASPSPGSAPLVTQMPAI